MNWKIKISKSIHRLLTTIDDAYENLEGYYPMKKRRVLIVFDYMIAISPIVTELF